MMNIFKVSLVFFTLFLLSACDNDSENKQAEKQNNHLLESKMQALEAAKKVENQLKQKFQREQKTLNKQSQ